MTDETTSCLFRGGSWYNVPQDARVAESLDFTPVNRFSFLGVRLVEVIENTDDY